MIVSWLLAVAFVNHMLMHTVSPKIFVSKNFHVRNFQVKNFRMREFVRKLKTPIISEQGIFVFLIFGFLEVFENIFTPIISRFTVSSIASREFVIVRGCIIMRNSVLMKLVVWMDQLSGSQRRSNFFPYVHLPHPVGSLLSKWDGLFHYL